MTATVVDPDRFRDVIGCFASGVSVITTTVDGVPHGTTASALTSVSVDPPTLLVCMNLASATGSAISSSGKFAVNILAEEHPALAARFATKDADKFDGVSTRPGQDGIPLLADALAHLECRVVAQVPAATHTVFLAEVHAAAAHQGAPLAYYRGRFGKLASFDQPAAASLDETLQDAIDARRAIEHGVAVMTVGAVSAGELRRLRRAMEQTLPTFADFGSYALAMDQFHETLIGLAGLPGLLGAYRQLGIFELLGSTQAPPVANLGRDFADVIAGYEAADLQAVHEAIERHHEHAKARVARVIRDAQAEAS